MGLRVAIAELLPWNNGGAGAAREIHELNRAIGLIGREENVPVLPFHHVLADPRRSNLMPAAWTADGDHPSLAAGYRRLGERGFRLP